MPQSEQEINPAEPALVETRSSRQVSPWRILGTLLSLALLAYLVFKEWKNFKDVLAHIPFSYLALALVFALLSRVSVSLRWFVLLRSARMKMSFWQSLRLTFMGLFASNFLPTTIGGDLVRMAGAMYLRLDAGVSAASLVVDRLVGMAGMASLAPFGMAIVLRPASGATPAPWLAMGFLARLERIPGVGWLYRKSSGFIRSVGRSSIYWLRHPLSLVWALLCTYSHMVFTFLVIAVFLEGMHQPLSFWWIGALWSLNYFFTTLVPVSINGLGLQEVSIAYLYSHFGGVSTEAGLALAVLVRVVFLVASLPGALFLPEILRPLPAMPAPDNQ